MLQWHSDLACSSRRSVTAAVLVCEDTRRYFVQHWPNCHIISRMLNHTRMSTVSAAVIVFLLFVQCLFISYVAGLRGQQRTIYSAFSREIRANSRKVCALYTNSETNDAANSERKQENVSWPWCPVDCMCVLDIWQLVINCEKGKPAGHLSRTRSTSFWITFQPCTPFSN